MPDMIPASSSRRAVLFCLGLGLLAMLAVSFAYRLINPALVVENSRGRAAQTMSEGSADDAQIAKLMQHLRDNPNDAQALVHLSQHLVTQQNWDAAATFVQRAVAAAPADPQPMYLLGVVQHNQGQHAQAAESLERVVRMKDEASVRYSLGILYLYYLNNSTKGVEHLTAGLHDPNAAAELKAAIRKELEKAPLPGMKSAPQHAPTAPGTKK